jgi:anti-anti-sigma regulatory factor
MHAPTVSEWLVMDEAQLVHEVQQAADSLNDLANDLLLDFSGVRRIDAAAIREMDKLASVADADSVKIGLRGVNVHIYKVLKLVKLASRFSFLS